MWSACDLPAERVGRGARTGGDLMTAPKSWRRCSECHRPTPLSKVSRPHCESPTCPWPVCVTCRPHPKPAAPPAQGGTSAPPVAVEVVVGSFVVADGAPGVWRVRDITSCVMLEPAGAAAVEYLRGMHGLQAGLLVRSRDRVTPHVP